MCGFAFVRVCICVCTVVCSCSCAWGRARVRACVCVSLCFKEGVPGPGFACAVPPRLATKKEASRQMQ